jgi:hypothetical protein
MSTRLVAASTTTLLSVLNPENIEDIDYSSIMGKRTPKTANIVTSLARYFT